MTLPPENQPFIFHSRPTVAEIDQGRLRDNIRAVRSFVAPAKVMAVVKAKDNDAVKQIGIEWCTQQSKELVAAGIPVLHYYSMGKAENIKEIAKEVF